MHMVMKLFDGKPNAEQREESEKKSVVALAIAHKIIAPVDHAEVLGQYDTRPALE